MYSVVLRLEIKKYRIASISGATGRNLARNDGKRVTLERVNSTG